MRTHSKLNMLPRYFIADMISSGMINDDTIILISDFHTDLLMCSGHWYDDNVLVFINATDIKVVGYTKTETSKIDRLHIEVEDVHSNLEGGEYEDE